MAAHSSVLAWEILWTEERGGLQLWGRKESGKSLSAYTLSPPSSLQTWNSCKFIKNNGY